MASQDERIKGAIINGNPSSNGVVIADNYIPTTNQLRASYPDSNQS